MKKTNEDPELEFELQEVYLTGKQWQSDLSFLEEESNFLAGQLSAPYPPAIAPPSQHNLAARLANARDIQGGIRIKLDNFIQHLELLLLVTEPEPDLALLEDFVALQAAVRDALDVLKGIKYALVEARRAA
ncbi:hypothetical protein AAFN85_03075 [Mucilaginibacter sp. CAU 1740]|uniref:hypothetical protein n=1 Tax=Mucilaginibacter sp. CAU 1740 TaxID=3140365 RepID=UPI00325B5F9E